MDLAVHGKRCGKSVRIVIQFPTDLGVWIQKSLDRGWPVATLVLDLIEHRMEPHVAKAIVEACATARQVGCASPLEAVFVTNELMDLEPTSAPEGSWARAVTLRREADEPV